MSDFTPDTDAALMTLLSPLHEPNAAVSPASITDTLRALKAAALDRWPRPRSATTLQRWQRLAQVAAAQLSLAKLYESHTDALAILAECGSELASSDGLWAVWAAEPPNARVHVRQRQGRQLRISGRKAWCSGGQQVDWALLTAWDEWQQPQLVAIRMGDAGQHMLDDQWQAVGMAATQTVDFELTDCPALLVGEPGQYVGRPGFWQGSIGIAACWYGAATGLAGYLHRHCLSPKVDPHALAHLGAVDAALAGARAVLHESATWIDAHPRSNACLLALRARGQVEHAVQQVLEHVGRALGAGPFCRNSHFAHLMADLPVFIRQSHAERDLAQLGERIATENPNPWTL
jgi:alkylation response protein AidB-like acyl-CoA dehydrogenase